MAKPKSDYTERYTIMLSKSQRAALERIAAEEQRYVSEVLRRLVDEALRARGVAQGGNDDEDNVAAG